MPRTERRALRKRHQEFMGVTGRRRKIAATIIFRVSDLCGRPRAFRRLLLIEWRNLGVFLRRWAEVTVSSQLGNSGLV
jgi:hypothetical protein